MRLTPEQDEMIEELVAGGVRVYLQGNDFCDKSAKIYRTTGCMIHDFPEGITEGNGFSIPEFNQFRYSDSPWITEGNHLEVKDKNELAYVFGLMTCTAIFFFLAKEPKKYVSVYAYHAPK